MSAPGSSEGGPSAPGEADGPADAVAAELTELVTVLIRLRPRDVSLSSEWVLASAERLGPQRIADLASTGGVAQPSMTELVSRLERDGLVRRERDPADGRAVRVALTERGAERQRSVRMETRRRMAELIEELSAADRAALHAALPALSRLHELGAELDPADSP